MGKIKHQQFVSIILVNYNGKKWLNKCLNSLLQQSYPQYEIIIVDNSSTDGSIEYVQEMFPMVRIIRNTLNLGFAGGNNIGISKAKGQILLLLNNDTWVENDFLEKMVTEYKRGKYDVIAPQQANYDGSRKTQKIHLLDIVGYPTFMDKYGNNDRKNFYLTGACLLFSKKLYEETGGMDDSFFMYFEETDWFWRLNLYKKKFAFIENIFLYHAVGGSTAAKTFRTNIFLWRNQNMLQMVLKNYSIATLLIILPLYLIQNMIEVLFFIVILRLDIAKTYIAGISYNIKILSRTLKKRRMIQRTRLINDIEILKRHYWGSGKIRQVIRVLG